MCTHANYKRQHDEKKKSTRAAALGCCRIPRSLQRALMSRVRSRVNLYFVHTCYLLARVRVRGGGERRVSAVWGITTVRCRFLISYGKSSLLRINNQRHRYLRTRQGTHHLRQ